MQPVNGDEELLERLTGPPAAGEPRSAEREAFLRLGRLVEESCPPGNSARLIEQLTSAIHRESMMAPPTVKSSGGLVRLLRPMLATGLAGSLVVGGWWAGLFEPMPTPQPAVTTAELPAWDDGGFDDLHGLSSEVQSFANNDLPDTEWTMIQGDIDRLLEDLSDRSL